MLLTVLVNGCTSLEEEVTFTYIDYILLQNGNVNVNGINVGVVPMCEEISFKLSSNEAKSSGPAEAQPHASVQQDEAVAATVEEDIPVQQNLPAVEETKPVLTPGSDFFERDEYTLEDKVKETAAAIGGGGAVGALIGGATALSLAEGSKGIVGVVGNAIGNAIANGYLDPSMREGWRPPTEGEDNLAFDETELPSRVPKREPPETPRPSPKRFKPEPPDTSKTNIPRPKYAQSYQRPMSFEERQANFHRLQELNRQRAEMNRFLVRQRERLAHKFIRQYRINYSRAVRIIEEGRFEELESLQDPRIIPYNEHSSNANALQAWITSLRTYNPK